MNVVGVDAAKPNEFLNLSGFEFKVSQINFTPSPTFAVTSSLTGTMVLASGNFGASTAAVDQAFTLIPVDVSGTEFDNIMEGTSVTFNITATAGSDTTGTIRVDKVDVQGVVVIPEPSSAALLLGGVGTLLLRRRRA